MTDAPKVPPSAPAVPADGQVEATQDPLSKALLPVLIHELNNATQLLTSLNALLAIPGGERFLTERAPDMTSVGEEVLDLGWLMAALATASGDDLLLARRHETGLDVMVHYVRKALRRDGRDAAEPESPLPRIANGTGSGWEAAWAVGVFLLSLGSEQAEPLAWTWSQTDNGWIFEAQREVTDHAGLELLLQSRLPELVLESGEDSARLRIPASYLEAP